MISLTKTTALLMPVLFGISLAAHANETISVTLDGMHEVPSTASMASGSGSIVVADDKTVSGSVHTGGIDGTMAHIHAGAMGKNGPPIITLSKGEGGTWNVPPGSKLTDVQYAALKAGELYVNVHSAANPGGEIRGQLTAK